MGYDKIIKNDIRCKGSNMARDGFFIKRSLAEAGLQSVRLIGLILLLCCLTGELCAATASYGLISHEDAQLVSPGQPPQSRKDEDEERFSKRWSHERDKSGWLLVPGIYQDFGRAMGGEISLLHGFWGGVIGLALGAESRRNAYLEFEMSLGPLPLFVGIGSRLTAGKTVPQTTLSLPFFFFFPYWRWTTGVDDRPQREFGVMLKLPLDFKGGRRNPGRGPVDEIAI
jgi:hypothetical protein